MASDWLAAQLPASQSDAMLENDHPLEIILSSLIFIPGETNRQFISGKNRPAHFDYQKSLLLIYCKVYNP